MKLDLDEGLLTATECAKALGISLSYFYQLKRRYSTLPYHTFGSSRRYYYADEVKNFLLTQVSNVKLQ